jgi:hypothetical protein
VALNLRSPVFLKSFPPLRDELECEVYDDEHIARGPEMVPDGGVVRAAYLMAGVQREIADGN